VNCGKGSRPSFRKEKSGRGRGRERSLPLPDFSRKIEKTSAGWVDRSSYHTTLLGGEGG